MADVSADASVIRPSGSCDLRHGRTGAFKPGCRTGVARNDETVEDLDVRALSESLLLQSAGSSVEALDLSRHAVGCTRTTDAGHGRGDQDG